MSVGRGEARIKRFKLKKNEKRKKLRTDRPVCVHDQESEKIKEGTPEETTTTTETK